MNFLSGQDDFFRTGNQPISVRHLSQPYNKYMLCTVGHCIIAASRQGGSTLNLQCPVSSRELCKVLANFDLMLSMCVCLIER